jgi:NADPH2 dehydrogenase
MKSLETVKLNQFTLRNRLVMPPMCMYQAENGFVQPFHITHYGSRAIGGVGTIIVEATSVSPEGRISDQDLGIWDDQYIEGLKHLSDEIHRYGAKALVQLAHAGRKSMSEVRPHVAPSPLSFSEQYEEPVELDLEEIEQLKQAFVDGARRAIEAGFDGVEIHAAHGYLINAFLSPLSNQRTDQYGASFDNRARLLREIVVAVREVIGTQHLLFVRISATDYHPEGLVPEDFIEILSPIKHLIDALHVSSGGSVIVNIDVKPGYQVPYAKILKDGLNIPVIAVGMLNEDELIEAILTHDEADFVALGRELLRNPYFVNTLYAKNNQVDQIHVSYKRGY